MRLPSAEALRDLVGWEAPYGVLSVYLEIDPGGRGGAWQIELRDQLDAMLEGIDRDDRELRAAVQATAGRIRERFQESTTPSGRMQIGFVECAAKHTRAAREEWFSVQYPVEPTHIVHGKRPNVRGLAEILDDGRPRGVAALSSERVRLFEWRLGTIEEVAVRELEVLEPVWRERKAPRMRDPASGQAVSSAGHDQHDQRLDQQRRKFLKQIGSVAAEQLGEDARTELLCIGEGGLCEAFLSGWDSQPNRVTVDPADVIAEPTAAIAERATARLTEADAERDTELVGRVIEASLTPNGSAALGPSDVARALARSQVGRLLIDAEKELGAGELDDEARSEIEAVRPLPAGRLDDWIIEEAIHTSASITALRAAPAERLTEHGGVAAILRY